MAAYDHLLEPRCAPPETRRQSGKTALTPITLAPSAGRSRPRTENRSSRPTQSRSNAAMLRTAPPRASAAPRSDSMRSTLSRCRRGRRESGRPPICVRWLPDGIARTSGRRRRCRRVELGETPGGRRLPSGRVARPCRNGRPASPNQSDPHVRSAPPRLEHGPESAVPAPSFGSDPKTPHHRDAGGEVQMAVAPWATQNSLSLLWHLTTQTNHPTIGRKIQNPVTPLTGLAFASRK